MDFKFIANFLRFKIIFEHKLHSIDLKQNVTNWRDITHSQFLSGVKSGLVLFGFMAYQPL